MTTDVKKVQLRRGTSTQWAASNPVLAAGEVGYDTTTHRTRTGDGTTTWSGLADALTVADVNGVVSDALTKPGPVADYMGVTFVPQSSDGVWIGSKRYADLQSALAAATDGTRIYFIGDYAFTERWISRVNGLSLHGAGYRASIIRDLVASASPALQFGDKTIATEAIQGINLERFRILGPGASAPAGKIGHRWVGVQYSTARDLRIEGFGGANNVGWVMDTKDDAHGNAACIRNAAYSTFLASCDSGLLLTKDTADSGTDGCNHNLFEGTIATLFKKIGVNNDWGEFNTYNHTDSSSSADPANIGMRIADSVCSVRDIRADGCGTGVLIDAQSGGYIVEQITGNGQDRWVNVVDASIPGRLTPREGITVNTFKNVSGSTIAIYEVAYQDSTCGSYEVKRLDPSAQRPGLLVCTGQPCASGDVGMFAQPGEVVAVKCDAGTINPGDSIIGSTTTPGSGHGTTAAIDQRFRLGRAVGTKGSAAGNVRVLIGA